MLRDRLFRGFLAGSLAGLLMNLFSYLSDIFDFTQIPFWEWAAIIILGREEIQGVGETILGLVGHLIFTGVLGIIFAYLLPQLKSRIYLFKGWLYGVGTWFLIYSINHLFRVQGVFPLDLKTALSNFAGASIYGLALGWVLKILDTRIKMN